MSLDISMQYHPRPGQYLITLRLPSGAIRTRLYNSIREGQADAKRCDAQIQAVLRSMPIPPSPAKTK